MPKSCLNRCYLSTSVLVFFGMSVALLGSSCAPATAQKPTGPETQPTLAQSRYTLELNSITLTQAAPHFQDPISQQIFNSVGQMATGGLRSLTSRLRFGPSDSELTSGPAATLQPGQLLHAYLLLIDTLAYPHAIGLVATLDYQPIQVTFNSGRTSFPVIHVEPGQRYAFSLDLPALPEGVHTLIVTDVVDPWLDFNSDVGRTQAASETMGLRHSPFEEGVLFWVTRNLPVKATDWPIETRPTRPQDTVFVTEAVLRREMPQPNGTENFFVKDTVKAGQTVTYYLRLSAPPGGETGSLPYRTLVFWDNQLTQSQEWEMPVEKAFHNEFTPFEIRVPSALSTGQHFLSVIVYPYPYYLRGWIKDRTWQPGTSIFSHDAVQVPIQVN